MRRFLEARGLWGCVTAVLLSHAACTRLSANGSGQRISVARKAAIAPTGGAKEKEVADNSRDASVAPARNQSNVPNEIALIPLEDVAMVYPPRAIRELSLRVPHTPVVDGVYRKLDGPGCKQLMARTSEKPGMFLFDCRTDPRDGLWAVVGAMEPSAKTLQWGWTSGHWTLLHSANGVVRKSDRQTFRCTNGLS